MSYGKKTVWILGAGFSRSLGGPLLGDLLTERGALEFDSRFPSLRNTYLYLPYLSGLRGNRSARMQLWSDVEEFLEFMDLGMKGGSAQNILARLLVDEQPAMTIEMLKKRVTQSVAGDCSFAMFADPSLEAWEPYQDWYKTISEKDTIITFNYDTVVESIGQHLGDDRLRTILPWEDDSKTKRPMLLKLHGSIDWCYVPNQNGTIEDPKRVARWDPVSGELPLIGMPGPSKAAFRKAHFRRLWELATHHIREAEVIVFLGYRFPPSDAQSRKELLGAIRANNNPYLRVHVVLGPNVGHADTIRLVKMIETVLKGKEREQAFSDDEYTEDDTKFPSYRVIAQPLLVQDFFTVMDRRMLDGFMNNMPAGAARVRRF